MIVFNLDAKPLCDNLKFCNDYTAKIIKSALSIPLLKYDRNNNKIIDALCSIDKAKKGKMILKVNNYKFSDGEQVSAQHIKDTIKYLINNDNQSKNMLSGLKKIIAKNDYVIIYHKPNVKFAHLLTNIKFSPFNQKGNFCGKYKIKEYENNYITLESNMYNSKWYNIIKVNFEKNNIKDVKSFIEGRTDFTNPTTFPLQLLDSNKNELQIYKNYIFFHLTFTNKKLLKYEFKDLRKIIYYGICRERLVANMKPLFEISNNFLVNKGYKNEYFQPEKYKEPIYLTLGYDSFYPNKKICGYIKKDLEKYNIFIKLIKTDYYSRKLQCDLQLNLSVPDYFDDSFYYCSKYFELLVKLTSSDKISKFKKCKTKYLRKGDIDMFNKLQHLFDSAYAEIPILIGNAVYLSKNCKFNFVDLDFDEKNFQ